MSGEDTEPKRVAGIPVVSRSSRTKDRPAEQYVAGLPRSWFRSVGASVDFRWIRHPIQWLNWRSQVRKLGPYAPRFENTKPKNDND
jgi:hypothetical protein